MCVSMGTRSYVSLLNVVVAIVRGFLSLLEMFGQYSGPFPVSPSSGAWLYTKIAKLTGLAKRLPQYGVNMR